MYTISLKYLSLLNVAELCDFKETSYIRPPSAGPSILQSVISHKFSYPWCSLSKSRWTRCVRCAEPIPEQALHRYIFLLHQRTRHVSETITVNPWLLRRWMNIDMPIVKSYNPDNNTGKRASFNIVHPFTALSWSSYFPF